MKKYSCNSCKYASSDFTEMVQHVRNNMHSGFDSTNKIIFFK